MITPEEIEIIVGRDFNNEPTEIVDYNLKSHSNVKVGFLGDHQNLEVTLKRGKSAKPETRRYFVKFMPRVSEEQLKFIKQGNIFEHEAAFFNVLMPLLRKDYVGEDFCPKCLLANGNLVVLEDLRTRGYAMVPGKIFDGEHLRGAVRAQARLHAAAMLAEDRLGKSLNDVCPEAHTEQIFNNEFMKERDRIALYVDLIERIAKRHGRDHRRVHAAFSRGWKLLNQPELHPREIMVTTHGDTWPNNYLFQSDDPRKAIMVDFQIVRYAPRMYDVAQAVYLCTSLDVRRAEERRTIETYHEELCKTLEVNNSALERPPVDDLAKEFEDVKMSAMLAATMYYPVIFANPKILNNTRVDELYKKIMMRDNNDYIMELYDGDKEYAEKLAELALEVVDYCEKHGISTERENGLL